MGSPNPTITNCLAKVPTVLEIRRQLADNLRERETLRQLLRVAEKIEVREARPCK